MSVIKIRERLGARMRGEESGFTLVELLVVMLILGLLAAIAIPAFFNQRDKAKDADAKATARTAQTAIETYATDHGGDYTGATAALLTEIEPTLAESGLADPTDVGPDGYTLTVTSSTGQIFLISRAGGITNFNCAGWGDGGCPEGGNWGGGEANDDEPGTDEDEGEGEET